MVCEEFLCIESCPTYVVFLAIIGLVCLYSTIAFVCYFNLKKYEGEELSAEAITLISIFWIIAIAGFVIYWAYSLILLPFTSAKKKDLIRLEKNINSRIDESLRKVNPIERKFKVGDFVTGIKGNPDNYKHLNEGSKCKVMSINDKGSMKLILVDHKDANKHKDVIGNTFTAPSRNFKLLR